MLSNKMLSNTKEHQLSRVCAFLVGMRAPSGHDMGHTKWSQHRPLLSSPQLPPPQTARALRSTDTLPPASTRSDRTLQHHVTIVLGTNQLSIVLGTKQLTHGLGALRRRAQTPAERPCALRPNTTHFEPKHTGCVTPRASLSKQRP